MQVQANPATWNSRPWDSRVIRRLIPVLVFAVLVIAAAEAFPESAAGRAAAECRIAGAIHAGQ